MCGIVGYTGREVFAGTDRSKTRESSEENGALGVIMDGLGRLEYRGYDSAGVALLSDDGVAFDKKVGKLQNLKDSLAETPLSEAKVGIGHTRWATHGAPVDANAHPHVVDDDKLAVVHNGIIENYSELKKELEAKGYSFNSETDTEVAAVLFEDNFKQMRKKNQDTTLTDVMQKTVHQLEGAFTLLAMHQDFPDTVVAARQNSPLVVGVGDGENFLGSDVAGFINYTKEAIEVGEQEIVTITPDTVSLIDFNGNPVEGKRFTVDWDATHAQKDGYDSFMAKEIDEQPRAVADTLLGRHDEEGNLKLDELRIDESVLKSIDKIVVVACGTAAYVGHVAKYAIEHWCRIPVEVELAHEFRYRDPIVNEKTLVIAISQSGETMDTLMAVRHAREQGAKVIAICNTNGSTIPRESDAVVYTHAGPEIAVASTKAFLAQITATYLLGLYLAQLRGNKYKDEISEILDELGQMPGKIQEVLDSSDHVHEITDKLQDTESVLFLGRHVGFPVALEGALKLKEISYIHAEGFAAGELKHGPIALIEEGQKVFVLVPSPRSRDSLHSKVISNMQEIRARGAEVIAIAEEGDEKVKDHASEIIYVPQTPTLLAPLVTTVPLQIFATDLAKAKGYDVDHPRNLAKSVTVE